MLRAVPDTSASSSADVGINDEGRGGEEAEEIRVQLMQYLTANVEGNKAGGQGLPT